MTQAQAMLDVGFAALLAVHGEPATYIPAGGSAATVTIIFDEASEIVDPETMVSTTAPRARTWTASVPSARNGDRLTVRGVTYVFADPRVDGLGVTSVTMARDAQYPIAPSGLSVVLEGGKPRLNWTRNADNNSAVEVWREVDHGGSFSLIATLGSAIVTYLDSAASVGFDNAYKVRNTSNSGQSPFSNTVVITVP